ncbi:hypothetical protein GOA63_20335 [Sinorhizobium meliloti]|uniref:hypothetical protein n=1 Tax=Rhizobium meliloti TaxID=382 RepID=UPI000FE08644|nr:hypothetical protein [Sinorhizobium meliloti]MDW9594553.1 hypothetical protein [Sinorhizobium meliloti]MDX0190538.1 hypothetical protein [Sinorhizobium meliloti]RVL00188.1 hypothetical protein CN150_04095 [Sinorhizobium meliloti]
MNHTEIYKRAEGYYFAMHLLKRRTIGEVITKQQGKPVSVAGPTNMLFSPQAMLLAFSLELYFKAIYARETGKPNHGHELDELFSDLAACTQSAIRRVYDNPPPFIQAQRVIQRKHGIPTEFDECLRISKKAFVQQRYIHEEKNRGSSAVLEDIAMAVRTYILNAYEDWRLSSPMIDLSIPLLRE